MERGNTKHGHMLDEALKHETEALTHGRPQDPRVEEYRMAEPSGEDQPSVNNVLDYDDEPKINGMSHADINARSEVAKYLRPSEFPCDRDRLIAIAQDEEAPAWVTDMLGGLPAGRLYENMQAIWTTLGQHVEEHRA